MEKKILSNLAHNQNVIVICPSIEHDQFIMSINRILSPRFKSICMITTNKPSAFLISKFQKAGIKYSHYHFIDCVPSKSPLDVEKGHRTITSPKALTGLSIALDETIKQYKVDLVLFDDISTLLLYNNEVMLEKFLHSLMTKMRATKAKAIYIASSELEKRILADLSLFADAVIQ